MQKEVTQDLSEEEIQNLTDDVIDAFGVNDAAVSIDTSYDITGSMSLDIPEALDDVEDLEQFLEENIADILGIDPSRVEVNLKARTYHVVFLRLKLIRKLVLFHTPSHLNRLLTRKVYRQV